jgi:phenylacetate-CoA ligase
VNVPPNGSNETQAASAVAPEPGLKLPWPARLRGTARVLVQGPAQRRAPYRAPERVAAGRRSAVLAAVQHAHAHVPYYRETLRRLGLGPADFRDAGDLARLPVIERAALQADPEYYVSERARLDACAKLQSGGSTGQPVVVYRDPLSIFQATIHAQRLRWLVSRLAGRFRFNEVIFSPPSSSGGTLGRSFRRSSLITPNLRSRRTKLSMMAPPSEHVAALNELRPDVIGSYGSYVEALFVYLEASGEPCHVPKVVMFSADGMSDSARRLITERFGVHVVSAYQSIEAGQAGFECEEHRGFHLNDDFCPVRVVDAEGRDVPEGESGDIVTSDLTNRATMLLNYRLGDVASALPGPCPCGRTLPMLTFLEGRTVEWVRTAAGKLVHPQSARMLLRKEDEVRRYQVVQRAADDFDLALVVAPGCDRDELVRRVAGNFREQFGAGTRVDVRFVDDLPRTPGGKVRSVVSLPGGAPGSHGADL